jgi:hypothetical protein
MRPSSLLTWRIQRQVNMFIPKIVAATLVALAAVNPVFPVDMDEGTVPDDIGQTTRYVGDQYEQTVRCEVLFDQSNFANSFDRFSQAGVKISERRMREFILMHETGHCYDGVAPPAGVDAMEWREYFADSFAAMEMYANGAVSIAELKMIARVRKINPARYAHVPVEEILPLLENGAYPSTTAERLIAAKSFRAHQMVSATKTM